MALPEDHEGLAAEYVLGTLDPAERAEVERAMANDPAFRAVVDGWDRRLAPLALALEPQAVPSHIRERVMAAIAREPKGQAQIINLLERRLSRWRQVAIGTIVAAAAAIALVLVVVPRGGSAGGTYVAVLQGQGSGPTFVASVDLARGTITVRPVAASLPAGKSYELWAIGAGRARPESLGVITADFQVPTQRLGQLNPSALGATSFAISLEPAGGSPTGQPTGPVVFSGSLVATE
jgi:anti-sigma-K factor RskA